MSKFTCSCIHLIVPELFHKIFTHGNNFDFRNFTLGLKNAFMNTVLYLVLSQALGIY